MPVLKDSRETEKVQLPSWPDSEVVIYKGLSVKDFLEADEKGFDSASKSKAGIFVISKGIKSWNFTDEKNQPLPINENSIGMLPLKDFEFLAEKINPELKKNLEEMK